MNNQTSLSQLTTSATLAQIVVYPDAVELLESIGLKLADYGGQSLCSACQQHQFSETEVLKWVQNKCCTQNGEGVQKELNNSLVQWSDYLKEAYCQPNMKRLKEIKKDFPRVCQIHGIQYPWLKNMQWQFNHFAEALGMYYRFEQEKFYPLLENLQNANGNLLDGTVKKVERGIDVITQGQERLKEYMNKLDMDSQGF